MLTEYYSVTIVTTRTQNAEALLIKFRSCQSEVNKYQVVDCNKISEKQDLFWNSCIFAKFFFF